MSLFFGAFCAGAGAVAANWLINKYFLLFLIFRNKKTTKSKKDTNIKGILLYKLDENKKIDENINFENKKIIRRKDFPYTNLVDRKTVSRKYLSDVEGNIDTNIINKKELKRYFSHDNLSNLDGIEIKKKENEPIKRKHNDDNIEQVDEENVYETTNKKAKLDIEESNSTDSECCVIEQPKNKKPKYNRKYTREKVHKHDKPKEIVVRVKYEKPELTEKDIERIVVKSFLNQPTTQNSLINYYNPVQVPPFSRLLSSAYTERNLAYVYLLYF